MVNITGTNTHFGKTEAINEQIALKDLKGIVIYAVGGSGANGYPGSTGSSGNNGSDGSSGWNGSDGCPPSNGSNGSDGSNGTDGGPGGNGGDAGHGGNGGTIKVNTSPDQSELMLFVKTATGAGGGGSGGPGGSGGSGGRGGSGGQGGRGGSNTCKDDKGNPTGGSDGSSGSNGSNGRDGSSGSSGYSGRDGYSGKSGGRSFNLVLGSSVQTYPSIFDLDVTSSKFVDDSGDQILEPGERAYLTSLQVSNKGPMPSPAGQTIKVSFLPSAVLTVPASLQIPVAPVGPAAASVVNLKKGTLTLQVPDSAAMIGKKAVTNVRLMINNVAIDSQLDTGMSVHWPVSMSAAVSKSSHSFDIAKPLVYTLKNVGAAAIGPAGTQPVYVELTWTSKTVPGGDVSVTLADGRVFNLAKSVMISDLTIPANGTAPLTLNFLARDSKQLSAASGNLNVTMRLKDFTSPSEDTIQSLDTAISIGLDLKSLEWNQTVNLAQSKISCQFPSLATPAQPIASFQVAKAKGKDAMTVQVAVPASTAGLGRRKTRWIS
jgi:hypothetical protein